MSNRVYSYKTAKLNWALVEEIREEYANTKTSYAKLGQKYNVDASTVGRIIRREAWTEQETENVV